MAGDNNRFEVDESDVDNVPGFSFFQGTDKLQGALSQALGLDVRQLHTLEYKLPVPALPAVIPPTSFVERVKGWFTPKDDTIDQNHKITAKFNQQVEYMLVIQRMLEKAKREELLETAKKDGTNKAYSEALEKEIDYLEKLYVKSFLNASLDSMNFEPTKSGWDFFPSDSVTIDGHSANKLGLNHATGPVQFKPYSSEGCPLIDYEPVIDEKTQKTISAKYTVKHKGNREVSIKILVATIFRNEGYTKPDGSPHTITIFAKDPDSARLLYLEFKAYSEFFSKAHKQPELKIQWDSACEKWKDQAEESAKTTLQGRVDEIAATYNNADEVFKDKLRGGAAAKVDDNALDQKLEKLTEQAALDVFQSVVESSVESADKDAIRDKIKDSLKYTRPKT